MDAARPRSRDASSFTPGTVIDGCYRLEECLREGQLDEVWRAQHLELPTQFALRIVAHEDIAPRALEAFRREEQLRSQLCKRTEHLLALQGVGFFEGAAYLAMEFFPGECLDERSQRCGPLPLAIVARLLDQCADVLTVAHDHGVLHNDISSVSIMMGEEGNGGWQFKVVDFLGALPNEPSKATFQLLGIPEFMSPERIGCSAPQVAGDLWSLAVVAYLAASGKVPFEGERPVEILEKIVHRPHTPVTEHVNVPPNISRWFDRAFEKDIADRFPTATIMAKAFRDALDT